VEESLDQFNSLASLFEEAEDKMAGETAPKSESAASNVLVGLRGKTKELAELAASLRKDLTPPGHMQADKALAYMARVYALFSGASEAEVQLGLGAWACVHDVGGTQDFTGKPPVVVKGIAVAATEIFGKIIPVTNEGEPRQFCATMFEEAIDVILEAHPDIRVMLAQRCAKAGLGSAANPKEVVSFVKGVTITTTGSVAVRAGAKSNLLSQSSSPRPGGARAVEIGTPVAVGNYPTASGHDLF